MILQLFASFLLVGLFAYGGGTATISLIYHELVVKRNWLTDLQMNELITLAEMTPGPLALNAATLTGYRLQGLAGSAVATVAVVLPSLLILSAVLLAANASSGLSSRLDRKRIMTALRPGILTLLLASVVTFGRSSLRDWYSLAVAAASLAALALLRKLNPLWIILLSGVAGVLIYRGW